MRRFRLITVFLFLGFVFNFIACTSPSPSQEKACNVWEKIVSKDSLQFLYREEDIFINEGKNYIFADESQICLAYNGGYAHNIDSKDISFTIEIHKLDKYLSGNIQSALPTGLITQEDADKILSKIPEFKTTAKYFIRGDIYVDGVTIRYRFISFDDDLAANDFYDWFHENFHSVYPILKVTDSYKLNKNEIIWLDFYNFIAKSPEGEKIKITNKIIKKIESASDKLSNMKKLITQ